MIWKYHQKEFLKNVDAIYQILTIFVACKKLLNLALILSKEPSSPSPKKHDIRIFLGILYLSLRKSGGNHPDSNLGW